MDCDHGARRRLVERAQMICAVDFLASHGLTADDIVLQLTRNYYVDIDLLNDVLGETPVPLTLPAPQPSRRPEWLPEWRKVA